MICHSNEEHVGGGGAHNHGEATGRAAVLAEAPHKQTLVCIKVIPWGEFPGTPGRGEAAERWWEQAKREHPPCPENSQGRMVIRQRTRHR